MSNSKRTTLVVGAGAPLDLNIPDTIIKPSTKNITSEVLKPYDNYLKPEEPINIVREIYDVLVRTYPIDKSNPWIPEPKIPNINFEHLFHVLEMLNSYSGVWENKCEKPDIFPVFAPFTKSTIKFDSQQIHSVMKQFILRIMDIIDGYNGLVSSSENKWCRDFYELFREDSDFYIFNYDTTIEDTIGTYEDGFESDGIESKFQRFNPLRLLNYSGKPATINHLHGCINFYRESYKNRNQDTYTFLFHDLYKYTSYSEVKSRMVGSGGSNQPSQSGESYFFSPIVTGLRKTDKLNCIPFDFYHGNMYQSIVNNNKLIIIGYSFGDLYCNQLLERIHYIHKQERRIVIIDYWQIGEEHHKLHGGYFLSDNMGQFICRAMEVSSFDQAVAQLYDNEDKNTGALYSNNGCLMVLPGGFHKAAQAYEDIIKFLNS